MDGDVTIIEPPGTAVAIDFQELWRHRELFWFLAWRDFRVRYKQTALGMSWAVVAPVVTALSFAFLFGYLGRLPTDGLPAAIYYLSGLTIWRCFSTALGSATNSLVANSALVTKVYVPRLILPAAAVVTRLIDFAIALGVLLGAMLLFSVVPAMTFLLAPAFALLALLTAFAVSLFASALNVHYRDVGQALPFVSQLWMFLSVLIPFSRLPESWGTMRYFYGLNPMGGIVEGFRWAVAHQAMNDGVEAPWTLLLIGTMVTVVLLLAGLWVFRRLERQFADMA
ncbi:MAG: ABC transporter permease [Myxococcota bacterium]